MYTMLSRLRSRSDATDDDDAVASSASRREGVLLSPSPRLSILLLLLPLLLLVVLPRAVSRLSPPDVPLQPQPDDAEGSPNGSLSPSQVATAASDAPEKSRRALKAAQHRTTIITTTRPSSWCGGKNEVRREPFSQN